MKKFFQLLIISILAEIILFSCSQDASNVDDPNAVDPDDHTAPMLTVSKPVNNQIYINGDSIIVDGKATDEKALYRGGVQIKNESTNTIVAETYYGSLFLQNIDYHLAYKATVSSTTNFSVFIQFQDHGRNAVGDTIKVRVNP